MAITLNAARLALSIAAEISNPQDLGSGKFALNLAPNWLFTHGTGNGQANELFSDIRTLAASGTENIDLAGTLIGHFGETLTFTKIKAIVILADTGNTNDVVVGGAASNGFAAPFGDPSDTLKVPAGGGITLVAPKAGWTVTAGTGDLLKIANGSSGTPVTYTIVVIGVA